MADAKPNPAGPSSTADKPDTTKSARDRMREIATRYASAFINRTEENAVEDAEDAVEDAENALLLSKVKLVECLEESITTATDVCNRDAARNLPEDRRAQLQVR